MRLKPWPARFNSNRLLDSGRFPRRALENGSNWKTTNCQIRLRARLPAIEVELLSQRASAGPGHRSSRTGQNARRTITTKSISKGCYHTPLLSISIG